MIRLFWLYIAIFSLCCCNYSAPDKLQKGVSFKGVFIKEEKTVANQRTLFLKGEDGKVGEFVSMPFFSEAEQELLLKNGAANVYITYDEYYNPVKKTVEKIVKTITPVYKL
jgi:hypothetical protein